MTYGRLCDSTVLPLPPFPSRRLPLATSLRELSSKLGHLSGLLHSLPLNALSFQHILVEGERLKLDIAQGEFSDVHEHLVAWDGTCCPGCCLQTDYDIQTM